MTKEERRREIREIVKLVDQIAVLSHHRIWELYGIRVVLAKLNNVSQPVDAIKGCAEDMVRGGSSQANERPL